MSVFLIALYLLFQYDYFMIQKVFYVSGNPQKPKERPHYTTLAVKNDALLFDGCRFTYDLIVGVYLNTELRQKQFSAGKAVAGGLLLGGIGAIAGAASGATKAEHQLIIEYRVSELQTAEIVIATKNAPPIKKNLDKKLTKYNRNPEPTKTAGGQPVSKKLLNAYLILWKPYVWAYKKLAGKKN